VRVDKGAAEDVFVKRVADANFGPGFEEIFGDLFPDVFVQEEDGADGEAWVGIGSDDDAVVATEFEQRAAEAGANGFGDLAAHAAGARGGDEGDAAVVDHARADDTARAVDEREDAAQAVAFENAVGDAMDGDGGERRFFRRLPDDAIAADGGYERVPAPDGDGEVEGGDAADDAKRVPLLIHPVAGAFGVHGEAVELAGEADGEVGDVDHLLDFSSAFGEDFAGFEGDEGTEIVLGFTEGVADFADDVAAARGGRVAPSRPDFMGEVSGIVVVLFDAHADEC
jgi:hypothetical protein